jgi:hypothetical protein
MLVALAAAVCVSDLSPVRLCSVQCAIHKAGIIGRPVHMCILFITSISLGTGMLARSVSGFHNSQLYLKLCPVRDKVSQFGHDCGWLHCSTVLMISINVRALGLS